MSLEPLRHEAAREGFRFLDRLVHDWATGVNRFDAVGEKLLGVYSGEQLIAVGGLNRDPYECAPRTGRIRHLYVLPTYRRCGVGKTLLKHLLERADAAFDEVRLRTDNHDAALFYEGFGFERMQRGAATHLIKL